MLKQSYGKMKIKKGSILYHTSDNKFTKKMDKPFYISYILSIRIGYIQ